VIIGFFLQRDFRARPAWIVRHADGLLFPWALMRLTRTRINGMGKEYNFRILSFRRFVFTVPVHFLVVACGF